MYRALPRYRTMRSGTPHAIPKTKCMPASRNQRELRRERGRIRKKMHTGDRAILRTTPHITTSNQLFEYNGRHNRVPGTEEGYYVPAAF